MSKCELCVFLYSIVCGRVGVHALLTLFVTVIENCFALHKWTRKALYNYVIVVECLFVKMGG